MARLVQAIDFSRIAALPGGVRNHLSQIFLPGNGHAALMLRESPDLVLVEDHFIGTLDTVKWTATADAGSTAFAYAAATRGRLAGVTEAASADAISLAGAHAQWYGDQQCGMVCIFKVDVAANTYFEIGFADAIADKTLGVVPDVDVPTTAQAADLAVVVMDVSQTLTTMAFVTDGSTSGYNATKTNLGTQALVNDTYFGVKVFGNGDSFACEVFDATPGGSYPILQRAAHGDLAAANKVEGGTALIPYMFFMTRQATALNVYIDYAAVWQNR